MTQGSLAFEAPPGRVNTGCRASRRASLDYHSLTTQCWVALIPFCVMIRKLKSGEFRLYSRKKDPKTNKRRNLGTFKSRKAAQNHEKAVQYFKHGG